jgi:hypothetical protein
VVGCVLGDAVGRDDGKGVGDPATYVGATVGQIEGRNEGAPLLLGVYVGDALGDTVGSDDGKHEGNNVGLPAV